MYRDDLQAAMARAEEAERRAAKALAQKENAMGKFLGGAGVGIALFLGLLVMFNAIDDCHNRAVAQSEALTSREECSKNECFSACPSGTLDAFFDKWSMNPKHHIILRCTCLLPNGRTYVNTQMNDPECLQVWRKSGVVGKAED